MVCNQYGCSMDAIAGELWCPRHFHGGQDVDHERGAAEKSKLPMPNILAVGLFIGFWSLVTMLVALAIHAVRWAVE